MKNLKKLITLFVCAQFLLVFFLSNVITDKNIPLMEIEIESELEAEAEGEFNPKLKSKQNQLFTTQEFYAFGELENFKPKLLLSTNSYPDFILKVPTTPPNNC